jgi:hypothetical protein
MKTTIFGFSSLLLLLSPLTMAVPMMGKRDIDWVTVTDYTTLTIDMTTTLYVEPTGGPEEQPTVDATTEASTTVSTSNSPAQFFVPPTSMFYPYNFVLCRILFLT